MVHPSLDPPGGGNCVAAWVIEALREHHRLTVLAWKAPDLERVNDYFGTSLENGDFELELIPRAVRRLVDHLPTPSSLLATCIMIRIARNRLDEGSWDLVLSTQNEMDFGRPGIQYIHFPTFFEPRPVCDYRWYHRAFPFAAVLYRRSCYALARSSPEGVRDNLSLVNSDWTGEKVREFHRTGSRTVYPPVPGEFPSRPWERRQPDFVCLGRISPEKEIEKLIEIVERVREDLAGDGIDDAGTHRPGGPRLHVVGGLDNPAYGRRILAAARARDWVDVHLDLPRAELLDLLASKRYGLHGMVGEHFGIAVAEMQRAGQIVFVPDEGGQVEIVGGDPRITYADVEDATQKIVRAIADPDLESRLLEGVAERADHFTAERFMAEIRDAVDSFPTAPAGMPSTGTSRASSDRP